MDIRDIRSKYHKNELKDGTVSPDPMVQFRRWFDAALKAGVPELNAAALATATPEGIPSVRMVLLKDVDDTGFTFFTGYLSRKGRELELNPHAAMTVYWKELEQQIRVEGKVEKLTSTESDEYFDSRPTESKLSAVVSEQSQTIQGRQQLEERRANYLNDHFDKKISRPDHWGGYRILPQRIEFWQGRQNRLHDRILYSRAETGWKTERLQP